MAPSNKHRFVNNCLSKLHPADYNPLENYQSIPCMSLEDAVKNIIQLVPDVMSYVKIAKKNCVKNTKLNVNESASIYLYTMSNSFHRNLNNTLRNENRSELIPWFAYLKLFITALCKLPSHTDTVWRGIHNVNSTNFNEGDTTIWWGINSCSCDIRVADDMTCKNGVLFCIESAYAKKISKYSAIQDEEEVVLLPGTCLRIKGIQSENNGVSIVHLKEW